jgi:hypothetical protein
MRNKNVIHFYVKDARKDRRGEAPIYLKELLKWVSSDSLLVIDENGLLRRIFCPFNAICLVTSLISRKGRKFPLMPLRSP